MAVTYIETKVDPIVRANNVVGIRFSDPYGVINVFDNAQNAPVLYCKDSGAQIKLTGKNLRDQGLEADVTDYRRLITTPQSGLKITIPSLTKERCPGIVR